MTITREAAKYTGRHCVLAGPDGEPVSGLHDSQQDAESARERLLADYPAATIGYWPTRAEMAAYRQQQADADAWNVTSYRVVCDCDMDGVRVCFYPLTPALATYEQAQSKLAALVSDYPDARISEQVSHCRTLEQWNAEVAAIVQP